MEINNPQWLEINSNGHIFYGLSQTWFSTFFKRNSGCGPTAASMLLIYLNKRNHALLPYQNHDVASAIIVLEDVWRFVTPGLFGLYKTKEFASGIKKLCEHYKISCETHVLNVKAKEPIDKIISFIESGLSLDCPIAFLNLHKGVSSAFEGWHWIVLTALTRYHDQYMATAYDNGRKIEFDLGEWVASTKTGGGFVYIT